MPISQIKGKIIPLLSLLAFEKKKRVRQDFIMVFDDEGTVETEVHKVKKKKKKRGNATPCQLAKSLGSAYSSPHPYVNRVTYYLLSLFFYSD